MKKVIGKGFLTSIVALLFCLAPLALFAQGKDEIAVRTKEGTNVPKVNVHILDAATVKCQCVLGFCSPKLVDSETTDKNGIASFRGGKHKLAKSTDYWASIDDKCTLSQQVKECKDPQMHCSSSGTLIKFTTDDKGKFTGFEIKK